MIKVIPCIFIYSMQAPTSTLDIKQPIHTRRCRQCFVNKPLDCYLNKSRTSYCVICDRCRSSQRRRYHRKIDGNCIILVNRLKKLREQEKEAHLKAMKKESIEGQMMGQSSANNQALALLASCLSLPSSNFEFSHVVPSAKWIPTKSPSGMNSDMGNVHMATLICDPRLQLVSTIPIASPLHISSSTVQENGEHNESGTN